MNKNFRTVLLYLVLLGVLVIVVLDAFKGPTAGAIVALPTSDFVAAVQDGRVLEVTYVVRDNKLSGKFWETTAAKSAKETPKDFTSTYVGTDTLAVLMAEAKTKYNTTYKVDASGPSPLITILSSVLPILLLVGVMFFFLNQMQGGNSKIMNFGKAKAKRMTRDQPRITFKDVAGVDEAIEELQEIKEFLANPGKFQALGAKIPKGVLLVGPPGTGKTLLARAVAGEAAVPFFSISGSDFVEMFVGVGASRVRDLFEQAKAASPCIIFVDEIDAVGRQRGAGLGGGHDEREQTLNQLLVEMDGFDTQGQRHPHRGHQPPRHPRSGASAPGPLRPPGRRGPPRPQGPSRHPEDPRTRQASHRRDRARSARTPHPGLHRGRPRRTSSTRRRFWPRVTARRRST